MSSQGVSRCCPSKDASGLLRDSMRVPSTFPITMQLGSKIERLSCPGKSVTSRSTFVATVITTFLRASPLLFTNQIAPVIDAATFTDFTLFQRSRPPCAFTAKLSNSFMRFPLFRRKRATLKMNKLDAVILFAIDSHQSKSGLALFSISHGCDLAIAGQDTN